MRVRGQPFYWSEERGPQWTSLVSRHDEDYRHADEAETDTARAEVGFVPEWASTERHYDYDAGRWVVGAIALADYVNEGPQDGDVPATAELIVVHLLGLEKHLEKTDSKGRSRGTMPVVVKDNSPRAVRSAAPFQRKRVVEALRKMRRTPEELRAATEANLEQKKPGYVHSLMRTRESKFGARKK